MLGVVFYPTSYIAIACGIILQLFSEFYCLYMDDALFKNKEVPDISRLSKLEHGTELVVIENRLNEQRAYRLEDFFWTGSGDGSSEDWSSENPATVFETKTILSTVYVSPQTTYSNQTQTKCPFNCESSVTPDGEINPTPTYNTFQNSSDEDYMTEADRQYWLLTVLRSRGKDPIINDLKHSLQRLYTTAFQRQQEHHLGIYTRSKRAAESSSEKPVNVYIHNISKSPINGNEKIDVLYHVAVSGQPVSATTAAADMHLVSDVEVITELGYPFIIKAEPYLKVGDPQYLSSSNNTWVFIGVALSILFILLLLVALLTLALSKRSKTKQPQPSHNNIDINQHGSVITNETEKGYQPGRRKSTPTYINFRSQASNCTLKSGTILHRPISSSSSSSFSITSLDLSPLMRQQKQHSPPRSVVPRPRAAINKTAPLRYESKTSLVLDSDSSDQTRQNSADTIVIKNYDPGVTSPKSYLSMPSVKSFPRGSIPEPLNKVLEPVSVLHLDILDDELDNRKVLQKPFFIRHGSLNTVEDPGVIGPVVWSEHCKRMQHGVSVDQGIDEMNITNNTTRMRKRFHDLLDETFSLFGSQRELPVDPDGRARAVPVEVKSHSAVTNRTSGDNKDIKLHPRPKTSVPRRPPLPGSEPPKGAWYSKTGSPLPRPLSAGPCRHPQIDVNRILATGTLHPNDPAIPLIAAIKTELGKCSLPGSTTDLQK